MRMSYDKRPEVLTQVRDCRGGSASTKQDFPEAQWYFSPGEKLRVESPLLCICWILIKSNFDRGSACKVVRFLYSAAQHGVYLVHLRTVRMSCIYFDLLSSSVQMWQIRQSCLLASQCMVLFTKLN